MSFTREQIKKKGNTHNENVVFGIVTIFFKYTSRDLGVILDTGSVEPLRRAGEVPKVIDEGVICAVDEPDRTVFPRVMHYRVYSSEPNRVLVSLVP